MKIINKENHILQIGKTFDGLHYINAYGNLTPIEECREVGKYSSSLSTQVLNNRCCNCGVFVSDDSEYCPHCGLECVWEFDVQLSPAPAIAKMENTRCSNCFSFASNGENYCSSCGFKFDK